MVTHKFVNICSGYVLLPFGYKTLFQPMLTCHQGDLLTFNWIHFPRIYTGQSSTEMHLKITHFQLQPHLPGVNEFTKNAT